MPIPQASGPNEEFEQLKQEIARLKAEREQLAFEMAAHKAVLENNAGVLLAGLEQFKLLADNVPVFVWTADPDGNVDYFNQRYSEYTGFTVEESLGWGWRPIIHPDDLERAVNRWQQSLDQNIPYEVQYRIKRGSDGAYRWFAAKALPLKDANGSILKWFGTNMDIHEQKEVEKQKDEFLSIASHELKTPLTSVKAFLQLGQKMIDSDTKAYGFVSKASAQLVRLESLISDLLDVSKINAGKMNYNLEPFNFNEALYEAVESVQQANEDYQIVIERNDAVNYNGDKLRIEQVINNLLVNAIKYSPNAQKVVVRSEIQQNNIVVSVQDFGIGIAPENLNKLFDRYYRVDNTSMRFQGLGLGLFISSEIIKRHNGSFWIESEMGKGSTFFFLLPINGKQELVDLETDNQTFYKGNFIEMHYDAAQQWMDVNWIGYQNLESVQKGCMIMLDLMKKNSCSKVLNDNTYVVGNWSEAADWGSEYWFPAMQDAGLRHFAWIYSHSAFSRMSAHKSVDVAMGNVTVQFFTEIDEARRWLSQVK